MQHYYERQDTTLMRIHCDHGSQESQISDVDVSQISDVDVSRIDQSDQSRIDQSDQSRIDQSGPVWTSLSMSGQLHGPGA